MRILSCNVRYSAAQDYENDWVLRKDLCVKVVREQAADLICCQEMSALQQRDLQAGLPEYEWFGMIDEPGTNTPVNSIFFRKDRFRHISAGGYWLSQTPHVPGSRSWQSACVRLCNWLRLVDGASGKEFRVANTHLDHISQPAREGQIAMVLEDSAAYPVEYPQLLTGDFNCTIDNLAIQAVLAAGWTDSYHAVHGVYNPGNTFHGFLGEKIARHEGKIDWIFTRGAFSVQAADIIKTNEVGRYPSDHYFISADVDFS